MPHSPIRDLSRCALFAALLCICGWIAIPLPGISITLQTFGVFLTLELLGGRLGTWTLLAYLLLGFAGLPVFSGFQSGITALTGPTGGYLWGFLISGLIYWAVSSLAPRLTVPALALGLLGCYLCGACWYAFGYLGSGFSGLSTAVVACVAPYIIPDAVKFFFAHRLSIRLKPFLS